MLEEPTPDHPVPSNPAALVCLEVVGPATLSEEFQTLLQSCFMHLGALGWWANLDCGVSGKAAPVHPEFLVDAAGFQITPIGDRYQAPWRCYTRAADLAPEGIIVYGQLWVIPPQRGGPGPRHFSLWNLRQELSPFPLQPFKSCALSSVEIRGLFLEGNETPPNPWLPYMKRDRLVTLSRAQWAQEPIESMLCWLWNRTDGLTYSTLDPEGRFTPRCRGR